nr:unnamed protein product [Naegleria fowleri]
MISFLVLFSISNLFCMQTEYPSLKRIEISSTFGKTENVTSNKAFRYSAFEDTTLSISVKFNANVTPIQVMTESLSVSVYNYYYVVSGNPDPSFTLLGVYRFTIHHVNVSDVQNDITLEIALRYPFGIFNVNSSTVGFYKFNSYYFSPTNSRTFYNYANFQTTVLSFCKSNRFTPCNIVFGVFGVKKDYTSASFGTVQTVHGPSSFRYILGGPYYNLQTLTLTFKGQIPYSVSPTFNLTMYTPNNSSEIPLNYYMLKAFTYETSTPEPSIFQQTWEYYFGTSRNFKDYSGKEIVVDVSKLECACKSSTSHSFSPSYGSIVSALNDKITCTGRGSKFCRYLAIIAPEPVVKNLETEGIPFFTTLRKGLTSYYKVSLDPFQTLYIDVKIYVGNAYMKIKKGSIPTSTNYDLEKFLFMPSSVEIKGDASLTTHYIAISNDYATSVEYHISVRSTDFQDMVGKKLSPILFFSIMSILFCALSGLIVAVVIRRNRRHTPKEYTVPDIPLETMNTYSMTPTSTINNNNHGAQYYEPTHHMIQSNTSSSSSSSSGIIPDSHGGGFKPPSLRHV